jgi:hypothetical protein
VEVELASVGEQQRAEEGHGLGGRPDVDDRVLGPRRALVVDRAAPDVDDRLAVVHHADGRADVLASVEVGGEDVGHRGEPLVEGPVELGHAPGTYPLAVQPSGASICSSRRAGCHPWPGS